MLPAGMSRYALPINGMHMHVMELGQGRPVLMLHGNPTWSFLYRKVAAELRGEPLRLIIPDLIGLGLSDKPHVAGAHTLVGHSRLIGGLIDELDLRGLVFVGQDWGGPIGLHALSSRSERVGGLVLLNTAVGPPRPGFRPTAFHRFSKLPIASELVFRLGFPQSMLGLAQGDRRSIRGPVSRAYRYPLRRIRDRVAPLALARMVPDTVEHPSIPALVQCQSFIERFGGPVSVVWGERDPILGRLVSWVSKLLPEAELTRTQAGHFLQEEIPEDIAAAVCSVAARLAAS